MALVLPVMMVLLLLVVILLLLLLAFVLPALVVVRTAGEVRRGTGRVVD